MTEFYNNIHIPQWYIVRPGDSLYTISRRYGVPVSDILDFNTIEDPNLIYAGQVIRLTAIVA
ncbi:hypothetical protein AGMMS50284_5460 [Clostridia bacterium]|nr:hypothetical protein AGMMS50284_5460 [Clostridia bacterium]